MAIKTTAAAGYNDETATWGGTLPNPGDQVVLAHPVTFRTSQVIGPTDGSLNAVPAADADYALIVNTTGKIRITDDATVTVHGWVLPKNNGGASFASYGTDATHGDLGNWLDIVDGTIKVDGVVAVNKSYGIYGGNNTWTSRRIKSTTHGRFVAVNGTQVFAPGAGGLNFDAANAYFTGWGAAATNMFSGAPAGGINTADGYWNLTNALFDDCGQLQITSLPALVTFDLDTVTFINGKNANYDLYIVAPSANNAASFNLNNIRCERGFFVSGAPTYLSVLDSYLGGLFVNSSVGTQFREWVGNTFKVPSGSGGVGSFYCPPASEDDCDEYRIVDRASINTKVCSPFATYGTPVKPKNCIIELAQDTVSGDPGEFLSGASDSRSGWGFRHTILLPTESGVGYMWMEPLNNGAEIGQYTFDHCSGSVPSGAITYALNFGHSGTTYHGLDRVIFTNNIVDNLGGATNCYLVGQVSLSHSPDAAYATSFDKNVLRNMTTTGTWPNTYWNLASTAQGDPTATLQANNEYDEDPWEGRVVDAASYYNATPGGRRVRTYGLYRGVTGADSDAEFANTLIALCAENLGPLDHPEYPAGHADYIANLTNAGLREFVREDWKPTNAALYLSGTDGTTPGAVEMDVPASSSSSSQSAAKRFYRWRLLGNG